MIGCLTKPPTCVVAKPLVDIKIENIEIGNDSTFPPTLLTPSHFLTFSHLKMPYLYLL